MEEAKLGMIIVYKYVILMGGAALCSSEEK
jgi:hypothetical protein